MQISHRKESTLRLFGGGGFRVVLYLKCNIGKFGIEVTHSEVMSVIATW